MSKIINKSDLAFLLSKDYEFLNETQIAHAMQILLDMMVEQLVADQRVEIRGFGSFSLHHREARRGRNPKTGETIAIPARAIPYFKPGKALKQLVDDSHYDD